MERNISILPRLFLDIHSLFYANWPISISVSGPRFDSVESYLCFSSSFFPPPFLKSWHGFSPWTSPLFPYHSLFPFFSPLLHFFFSPPFSSFFCPPIIISSSPFSPVSFLFLSPILLPFFSSSSFFFFLFFFLFVSFFPLSFFSFLLLFFSLFPPFILFSWLLPPFPFLSFFHVYVVVFLLALQSFFPSNLFHLFAKGAAIK